MSFSTSPFSAQAYLPALYIYKSFFTFIYVRATSRPGIAQLLKGSGLGRVSQGTRLICSAQPCSKHPVLGGGGGGLLGGVLRGDVAVSLQGGVGEDCGSL